MTFANYSYLSDGTKLSALDGSGEGLVYRGPLATATTPSYLTLRDGYTGKEDQTPDFSTGYTDFGARQYSQTLRRWMTPDPLSEKYYGISPYAFCNNNPVNLVDPDGKTWVNKQKQIVCDANGPTVYATPEEVELIKAMNSIKTGRQQLQKLIDAPFDVAVEIYHSTPPPNSPYGEFSSWGVKYDQDAERYVPKYSGTHITIYAQMAKKRSKRLGISLSEAMAVNFGHEIEHTTSENFELKRRNASEKEKDEAPDQISKDMISEFIYLMNLKSLKDVQLFPDPLIQTKFNIDIKAEK